MTDFMITDETEAIYDGPWFSTRGEAVGDLIEQALKRGKLFLTVEADFDIPAIADEYFIYDPGKGKFRVSPEYWTGEKHLDDDAFWALVQKHARDDEQALAWFLENGAEEYGKEKFADLCEQFSITPENNS